MSDCWIILAEKRLISHQQKNKSFFSATRYIEKVHTFSSSMEHITDTFLPNTPLDI